jgi:hypothetical protein
MKYFDGSAHVRIVHNSRLTINYFVFHALGEGAQPSTSGKQPWTILRYKRFWVL